MYSVDCGAEGSDLGIGLETLHLPSVHLHDQVPVVRERIDAASKSFRLFPIQEGSPFHCQKDSIPGVVDQGSGNGVECSNPGVQGPRSGVSDLCHLPEDPGGFVPCLDLAVRV